MDGSAAIERNRMALVRIVAALVAMAGLRQSAVGNRQSDGASRGPVPDCPLPIAATLPRYLWRAVLRLLRPAESAARRLIIAAARGIAVPPPPPPSAVPLPRKRGRIKVVPAVPPLILPCAAGEGDHAQRGGGGIVEPFPARIALPLFDRLRRVGPRPLASRDLPRICVPGWTERRPVPVRLEPSPDDPINAARLALRLDALARALDDLPRQARRFARWQAASCRVAAGAQNGNPAAGAQSMNPAGAQRGRFRRLSPLRGGPPPGGRLARYDSSPHAGNRRRREIREIDEILAHAHELAIDALERPDTS